MDKENNKNLTTTLYTSLYREETAFKTLYTWESPDRIWEEKDKLWYSSYTLFFVVMIAISLILGYYLIAVAIIAFAFLWFLQASTKPIIIQTKITTTGIRIDEFFIRWREIKHFWFSFKNNHILLQIDYQKEGYKELVNRTSIIINDKDIQNIYKILVTYADYGDKQEISYNVLTKIIYGEYIEESLFESNGTDSNIENNLEQEHITKD